MADILYIGALVLSGAIVFGCVAAIIGEAERKILYRRKKPVDMIASISSGG